MPKSISYEKYRKARLIAGAKLLREATKKIKEERKNIKEGTRNIKEKSKAETKKIKEEFKLKKYLEKKEKEKVSKIRKYMGARTIVGKPKVSLPSYSARKALLQGSGNYHLVKEGKVGTFDKELMEERIKWLG